MGACVTKLTIRRREKRKSCREARSGSQKKTGDKHEGTATKIKAAKAKTAGRKRSNTETCKINFHSGHVHQGNQNFTDFLMQLFRFLLAELLAFCQPFEHESRESV